MNRTLPLDAVDARVFVWVYAAIVLPIGIYIAGCDTRVFHGELLHLQPMERLHVGSAVRVAGAAIVSFGLIALGIGTLSQAVDRRRALGWFVAAHTVVFVMAWLQTHAIWDYQQPAGRVLFALGLAWVWLCGGWMRQAGDVPPLASYTGLFGERPVSASAVLRSQYEQQMRQAGALDERNRLARDLHDSVKQELFAIQTAAAAAEARLADDPEGARQALSQVRTSARDSMLEMNALLEQLRVTPLNNASLTRALRQMVEAIGLRTGATVACSVSALPPDNLLPPGIHLALFRAAQEALANTARHARASDIRVSLEWIGQRLQLTVADNGAGFETHEAAAGMGLNNIRARAQEFDGDAFIASTHAEGTTVVVTLRFAAGDVKDYRRKLIWAGLASSGFAVLFFLAPKRPEFMLVLLTTIGIDVIRYGLGWYRAHALRRQAA